MLAYGVVGCELCLFKVDLEALGDQTQFPYPWEVGPGWSSLRGPAGVSLAPTPPLSRDCTWGVWPGRSPSESSSCNCHAPTSQIRRWGPAAGSGAGPRSQGTLVSRRGHASPSQCQRQHPGSGGGPSLRGRDLSTGNKKEQQRRLAVFFLCFSAKSSKCSELTLKHPVTAAETMLCGKLVLRFNPKNVSDSGHQFPRRQDTDSCPSGSQSSTVSLSARLTLPTTGLSTRSLRGPTALRHLPAQGEPGG